MDILTIHRSYNNGEYSFHPSEDNRKLPDTHIFDGEKSVNWNRAEVISENTRRSNRRAEISRKNDELVEKLHSDVANYIAKAFNMSIKQAAIVESYVWGEQHSCMNDYFVVIDNVAEMISRVITAK